jgi:RNA polymerase sigma factor (sigma-70 family)
MNRHTNPTDDPLLAPLADCLERMAAGDPLARDRILEIVAGRLRTLAHRMLARFPAVRRWDDTDDVFQNAALRLHRSLGQMQLDSPRSVLALVATHVKRELLDLARRHTGPASSAANHATNVFRAGNAAVHHVERAADEPDDADRWEAFHAAIDALPPEPREVFHFVWYLGLDQKSIARLLGCSERTVKYRWRAAREAVRAALGNAVPT